MPQHPRPSPFFDEGQIECHSAFGVGLEPTAAGRTFQVTRARDDNQLSFRYAAFEGSDVLKKEAAVATVDRPPDPFEPDESR